MPWQPFFWRNSLPNEGGRTPLRSRRICWRNLLKRHWPSTPRAVPSLCRDRCGVPDHQRVPGAPGSRARRGPNESAVNLPSLGRKSIASIASFQEGPRYATDLFGEDRSRLASGRHPQRRRSDLVLDRTPQRIRKASFAHVTRAARHSGCAAPGSPISRRSRPRRGSLRCSAGRWQRLRAVRGRCPGDR